MNVCVPSGVKRSELTALWCQCRVEYVYSFLWLKFLLKGYSNVRQIRFHLNQNLSLFIHFIYFTHTRAHTVTKTNHQQNTQKPGDQQIFRPNI